MKAGVAVLKVQSRPCQASRGVAVNQELGNGTDRAWTCDAYVSVVPLSSSPCAPAVCAVSMFEGMAGVVEDDVACRGV